MVTDTYKIIPRYNEVDQMGYVYHANYVTYCHQARTEFMRQLGICDSCIEEKGIMMPVISFNIKYKKPIGYDEEIIITTILQNAPNVRLKFEFELHNIKGELVSTADTTIVFVEADTRQPIRVPQWIENVFEDALTHACGF